MKKRIFNTLLALCMLLCLMPTAAFAEESTETPPCSCETACTAESMNTDCPVCGAEGALPEDCAKCAQPKGEVSDPQPEEKVSDPQPEKEVSDPQPEEKVSDPQPEEKVSDPQPEGDVSDPQPETALMALIGGSATVTEVGNEDDLIAAIADSNVNTVKLTGDISISTSLTVKRTVTLDLNGFVLKYQNDSQRGSVIVVEGSGNLTLTDSNTAAEHKFMPNGKLWVLDEASGTETVTGGVITGGTGYPFTLTSSTVVYYGGGVYIASGGQLTMTGGNIIGCSATYGGGVCTDLEQTKFSMSGGSIAGCVASNSGGGVRASGKFQMSGPAVIRSCTAESATQFVFGGGVYVNSSSSFEMSDTAIIKGCQAISNSSYSSNGGGVYVSSSSSFVMSGEAKIEDCKAISNSSKSSNGGGVFLANGTSLTLSGNAVIQNCTATNSVNSGEAYGGGVRAFYVREITLEGSASIAGCAAANGSGLYITGSTTSGYGILYANGGSVDGDVVLGDTTEGPCTITGSGETVFNGKVTVTPGSTIENGKFNGEVINNGTIKGGTFNGTVNNTGTITGGTFNNAVNNTGTITGGTFSGGITGTPARVTGNGTENDPYQISTADGLKWFRDKVNSATKTADTQICAELTEDIDLSGEEWTPIGIGGDVYWGIRSYSGTFDGKGHTIKNLSIDNSSANFVGLFGYVSGGTIRNLTVSGSVKGSGHTGGIAGGADGGTFENCANLCVVQSDSTESGTTGGSIGFALNMDHELSVRDCYNVGSITGRHAGGIIGQCSWNETISNCYNAGTVTGTANAGAIIGSYSSDKISNCYYLDGSIIRKGRGDKASIAKTATEFADGTVVLALLKAGERDKNADPWADECKYLNAAGKTLPVFKGQGDAHEHQSNDWEHNETEHWQVCTCGAVFNKAAHSGGKATCKAKAVCEICKESYGSLDPNSHTDLKHVDAKAATAAAEGNIEYWYCEDCGKYFSDKDGTKEIAKAATVTAKLPPKITAGDGAAVTQGEKNELAFTSDASFADFLRVELDGTALEEKNYTKREGSTIITLNRDFVATLSVGEHTLSIVSKSGTATAKFTVKAKPAETATTQPTVTPQPTAQPTQTAQPQPTVQPVSPIPSTGDTATPALWFALLIVSGSALAAIFVLRRKDNRK